MAAKEKLFQDFMEAVLNGDERTMTKSMKLTFINRDCNEWKWKPIHFASERGHTEIVKALINADCNINCCTDWGWRPIHFASERGHTEIVRALISANCDIESRTDLGWRPIHFASEKGYVDIMQLLIDNDCEIECCERNGKTPMDLTKTNCHNYCEQLLLRQMSLLN